MKNAHWASMMKVIDASGCDKENVRTEQMIAAKSKNYIRGSKKGNWESRKYSTH
jgi:hypothetical protein